MREPVRTPEAWPSILAATRVVKRRLALVAESIEWLPPDDRRAVLESLARLECRLDAIYREPAE